MLKKIGKKAVSLLLAFVLIATTFFIFDPSVLMLRSKAVVDVKKLVNTVEPTVKFYVPEAIYLNPVVGTGSKPYNFQYFIDSDENGTLHRSATQTTGTVYFSCSAACTSITINWGDSVSPNVTENTHTNQIVKQTITGGTTSVKDGSVKVTATYVVEGKTYSAYAYTYMYYPELDLLTGTASSYVYKASGNEPKLSAFSFITGVHKVGNKTDYDNTNERGVSNYYDQYNGNHPDKGYYGISPLIPGWAHVWKNGKLVPGSSGAIFKTADDGRIYDRDIIYGEITSSLPTGFLDRGNGGVYFRERERGSGRDKTYGGINNSWGILYVDTSRVTDYNQIPNLRGGFICHYYQRCGERGEIETFASTDNTISILNNIDFRNGDGHSYGMSDADRLSGAVTSTDKIYNVRATYKYRMDAAIGSSHTVTMNQDFGLKVYPVNKKSLREAYRNAIENGWQSTTAKNHGWSSSAQSQWTTAYNNLDTALASAGEVLGRPYATLSDVSTALLNLNNRVTACNNIVNANFQGGENPTVLPQVYFYVPETIYLNPSDNQTFQYFYGVDTNGNPTKNMALSTAASGARIYFKGKNCTPSSVKITVASSSDNETTWSSVSDSNISSITYGGKNFTSGRDASTNGKTYDSFPVDIQCTAGKMNSAVTSSSYRFLKWTAEYVVGGVTYKTYAYTTVYSPYDKPAGASAFVWNTNGNENKIGQIVWVSGLTGCNTDGNKTNNTNYFNPIKGVFPQISNTTANGGVDQDSTYVNGSSGTIQYSYRKDGANDQGVQSVAPTGSLIIDKSRFENLKYVPNFKIGFIISYVNSLGHSLNYRRFAYYLSDVSNAIYTSPSSSGNKNWSFYNDNRGTYIHQYTDYETTNSVIDLSLCKPREVANQEWDLDIENSTTIKIKGATHYASDRRRGKTCHSSNACIVPVDITVVNKSSLRSRYYDAVTLSKQQDWYTAGYDDYQNSILEMAINVGHPARTKTDSTVITRHLVTNSGGTTTAVHLRGGSSADYNGNVGSAIIGSNPESKGYSYGDRVYGYYNEIPGFTKSNYSVTYGSTTKTSGILQDSTYYNYYYIPNANTPTIAWKFWYTPNTYSINYDPNGGTYNGSTGLTSTSVLFQSKYIVGKIGSATPANPTRPGCTFMGWKCSADGMVYQPGANINWEFLENVTFSAQWEYNSINLRFNENHDNLKPVENMFDPTFDEPITYESTASDSTACSLTVEKFDDGTLKANGKIAKSYTIGFVPMQFEAGATYKISREFPDSPGSFNGGCFVIELAQADGSNLAPRQFFNIVTNEDKYSYTFTVTDDIANKLAGIRFWVWYSSDAGAYNTYNNFKFKPRIEKVSDSTDYSGEYNNIFADYMQYNTLIQELPTATRTGYTFDGWYTQANGGTKVNVGDRLLYNDWDLNNTSQTLYAHWTINKYKLMYENEFDFDNFKFSMANPPVTNTNSPITINEHENSIQFTSQKRADGDTDDFTPTGQTYTPAETGYMTLIPGHTYEISYSYTVDKAASLNCYIFSYTSLDNSNWSGSLNNTGTGTYYNVGVYAGGATTGTQTGTYTVPQGRPYARLRFGSTTEGVTVKFSDICVRDLTDPLNYRAGENASDGVNSPSLNKKFDTVTYNTTQNQLASMSRQGYTFNGWFESENTKDGNGYGTEFKTSTKMPAKDVPLYAQWSLNNYTITVNLNADDQDKASIVSFDYQNASLGDKAVITLTPRSSAAQTVAGNIAAFDAAYGTEFTLPTPKRNGFTFSHWEIDGTTPVYGDLSGSKYRVGDGDVKIKAIWIPIKYNIIAYAYSNYYASNDYSVRTDANQQGGNVWITWGENSSVISQTNTSAAIDYRTSYTLHAESLAGYEFDGWYNKSTDNRVSTSLTYTTSLSSADIEYYAKFSVQSYEITFDADGADKTAATISNYYATPGTRTTAATSFSGQIKRTIVYRSPVTLNTPAKTGYTFKDWQIISGAGSLKESTFTCGAGIATVKAQWTAIEYTIRFNPNDGSNVTKDQKFTYDKEQALSANTFTRSGYTFAYWTDKADGSGTKYADQQKVKNLSSKNGDVVILYAQWINSALAETNSEKYVKTVVTYGYNETSKTVLTFKLDTKFGSYDPTNYNTYKTAIDNYIAKKNAYTSTDLAKAKDYFDAVNKLIEATKVLDNMHVVSFLENMTVTYSINGKTETKTGATVQSINLNHYSDGTLNTISSSYKTAKDNTKLTLANQTKFNGYVEAVAKAYTNLEAIGSELKYDVNETSKAVATQLGKSEDVEAISYVRTDYGPTYYCYTNSKEPKIVINALENPKSGTARIGYPTRFSASSDQGTDSYAVVNKTTGNAYSAYTNAGTYAIGNTYSENINGESLSGAAYYSTYSQIQLKPKFTTDKQTVSYTLSATDDALVKENNGLHTGKNYAKTTYLAGTQRTADTGENITIIISYHNSMGVFKATPAQVESDVVLNQYHLFRTAAGASNWELPKAGDTMYSVDHGDYGQCGLGSFTYTFDVTNSSSGYTFDFDKCAIGVPNATDKAKVDKEALKNAIIAKLDPTKDKDGKTITSGNPDYSRINSMSATRFQGAKSGTGLGYWEWGNNWSYNYYPKSNSFTYVHLVDRWGNTFDAIYCVGKMDYLCLKTETNAAGVYDIIESGGSGIATLALNATGFEILTDENSVMENNVFRTNGNTIRIKTGEANKSYTLNMKDKATNASTATVTSDENGIITLSITDEEYKSGVYTFKLNDTEINLYDKVNNHKYILEVQNAEVEEGETAELVVITTGEVIKARITDAYGNTKTINNYKQNDDGTRTWTFAKNLSAGEYDYDVTVKVGTYTWADGSVAGKIKVNARILDSGRIISAEYDPATNLYKVKVEGRGTKVQFITPDGMTRTYTRHNVTVKSITSYDADGEETNDTSVTLDYEVWMIDAKLASKLKYKVAGKFEAGWNRADDAVTYVVAN